MDISNVTPFQISQARNKVVSWARREPLTLDGVGYNPEALVLDAVIRVLDEVLETGVLDRPTIRRVARREADLLMATGQGVMVRGTEVLSGSTIYEAVEADVRAHLGLPRVVEARIRRVVLDHNGMPRP
ncbi:MAG: hypothetical protein Unbinned3992contig1000_8 [Prokaryotic dsDNA virus sp.]|nr:MAG: hypothetical protein Unbinned3992contig1000_8 [Prokaryotic dsDNA virus sp.]